MSSIKYIELYQGATYNLPIQVKIGKNIVTKDDIKKIEFNFGGLIKKYTRETAEFDNEVFIIKLSEKETLSIPTSSERCFQMKVVFGDGSIKFSSYYPLIVHHTRFPRIEVTDNE